MNNDKRMITIIILGLIMIFYAPAFAQKGSDTKSITVTEQKTTSRMFEYKPPMRGKPGNRIGGGTRGADSDVPYVAAMVPDHTGITTKTQPALYWYLSKSTTNRIEFTLINEIDTKPVLEISLNSDKAGIHDIELSKYNINLIPGLEYQWFVALVLDPEHRSKDVTADGTIKHIKPSKELVEKLAVASKLDMPAIYAEQGIWYDSLSTLSELIKDNPDDKNLLEQRTLLIKQVGLSGIESF